MSANPVAKIHLPIVSLFSGAGGLDLGFEKAGFEPALAVDVFPPAVQTYNHNRRSGVAKIGDLSQLDGESIVEMLDGGDSARPRGVIAGPPCQAFSHSNVYLKEDDIRRTLPGRLASILRDINRLAGLDFFVFENVRGLTFRRHRNEFDRFRFLFEDAGFVLYEAFLNAIDFGVPQDRRRVFIVGINREIDNEDTPFVFPGPTVSKPIVLKEAFGRAFGDKPWPEPTFFKRGLRPADIEFHPNNWTMNPVSPKFRNGNLHEGQIKGRPFRVLSWDSPSWTVAYGHREIHVHPSGSRRLSILEAMIIQGFPLGYELCGNLSDQVKLVSDSVPPPLAHALAGSVLAHLETLDQVTS